jgi:hypothetical protein
MNKLSAFALAASLLPPLACAQPAAAPIVRDAWVRPTVPGASVSAAYFTVESNTALKLLKADTAAAGIVELHDMKMKDGVMEMKAARFFEVPARGVLELKPGGKHIMLFKVKHQIKAGDKVPLALTFEGADNKPLVVKVEALAKAPGATPH